MMFGERRSRRWLLYVSLAIGLAGLGSVFLLLRLTFVTDYFYHATVKDPVRVIPGGDNIVSPADGTVLYVKPIADGVVTEVVKRGVPIPLGELIKADPGSVMKQGVLIGIYMNTESVHINRVPVDGVFLRRIIFNGPHVSMMEMDKALILTQLVPGLATAKKLLGMDPFGVEENGDYILKSARETSILEDRRGSAVYVIRIADYWVGKILTWIEEGQTVEKGQKMGMITWGSQVDICFERTPEMVLHVEPGDYVYAGETILASH